MALAASLLPGLRFRVLKGSMADEIVTIVDNVPFPDGDPMGRQRKITVEFDGQEMYILPRLLANDPEREGQALPTFQAPAPVAQEVAEATAWAEVAPLLSIAEAMEITDPMDHRLDHLRPNPAKVKPASGRMGYKKRMVPGLHGEITDIDFLLNFTSQEYRERNQGYPANIALKGDTQSGKTFLVEALAVYWAEAMGLPKPMPIFTLAGSAGVTDFDLFGQQSVYQGNVVWLPGMAALAAQCGGILYLDEMSAFSERVTSSLHPLTDHRHHFVNRNKVTEIGGQLMPETVIAHPDMWVIGTYNEGYTGMAKMNEAFINRFRTIEWGYDKDIEASLITSPAIRLLGEALRTARAAHHLHTPIGMTVLMNLEQDIRTFGISMAMSVLKGTFKAQEVAAVDEILDGRSIYLMLQEEQTQQRSEQNDTRHNLGPFA